MLLPKRFKVKTRTGRIYEISSVSGNVYLYQNTASPYDQGRTNVDSLNSEIKSGGLEIINEKLSRYKKMLLDVPT